MLRKIFGGAGVEFRVAESIHVKISLHLIEREIGAGGMNFGKLLGMLEDVLDNGVNHVVGNVFVADQACGAGKAAHVLGLPLIGIGRGDVIPPIGIILVQGVHRILRGFDKDRVVHIGKAFDNAGHRIPEW